MMLTPSHKCADYSPIAVPVKYRTEYILFQTDYVDRSIIAEWEEICKRDDKNFT